MSYELKGFQKEIWKRNYKYHEDKTIEDTWMRIAKATAAVEKDKKKWAEKFYSMLENFKFVPGGRTIANIGTDKKGTTLLNCFTHNLHDMEHNNPIDSLESIGRATYGVAKTLASEGGYGTNFSFIRPAGSVIKNMGVLHPGSIKYMEIWDKISDVITSGANELKEPDIDKSKLKTAIRKGAMMSVLSIWHPDIEEFITAKQSAGRLTKFNMSVGITKGFMDAVKNDETWELKFPDTSSKKYDTDWTGDIEEWEEKGYPVKVYKKVKAKELWNKIVLSTYNRNEPGILFLDVANKLNPISYTEKILQTNPCGEIPMSTGVCLLGTLNLAKFVKVEDNKASFDFDEFKRTVKLGVRFLDNVNDITGTPLPEYSESIKQKRRIGLGLMGLGSLHYMLKIRFGSENSLKLIKQIMQIKQETEILASAELGKEKGSFELFDRKKYFNSYWWKNYLDISPEAKKKIEEIGEMRNGDKSDNAPNGNTGIFAGIVSGGIEPVFMKEYIRWVSLTPQENAALKKSGIAFPDIKKGEWFETKDFKFTKKGDEQILEAKINNINYEIDKNRGVIKGVLVEDYGWSFAKEHQNIEPIDKDWEVTTNELTVEEHLSTLEIVAKHIDMNSSKTINIPNDYPFEKFEKVYLQAHEKGIKGITTYRAGTMTAVLEQKEEVEEEKQELEKIFDKYGDKPIKKLDTELPKEYYSKGYVIKDSRSKHKYYINVAFADKHFKKPYAMFIATNNRATTDIATETIQALEELTIKKGVAEDLIKGQKDKYANQDNISKIARAISFALRHNISIMDINKALETIDNKLGSVIFHIRKLLFKFVPEGTKVQGEKCPVCKGSLVYQEGCYVCLDCGYSKCS